MLVDREAERYSGRPRRRLVEDDRTNRWRTRPPSLLYWVSLAYVSRLPPQCHPITEPFLADEQITTADQFATALEQLLVAAAENDIDPRGAWIAHTEDGQTDWEVVVLELAHQDLADENLPTKD